MQKCIVVVAILKAIGGPFATLTRQILFVKTYKLHKIIC